MAMTPSELRKDIYRALDRVLETGVPLEIERRGRTLRIVAEPIRDKLDNLKPRDVIQGDPEDLVDVDWLREWRP